MANDQNIIDISVSIKEKTAVYPGDPEVVFEALQGKTSLLTKVTFGTHTGSHFDAPRHVFEKGKTIDQLPLDHFYGPCRVLNLTSCDESIKISDLDEHNISSGERILLKTKNSERGFENFREDFIYLDGDAAEYLVKKGIKLLGIDSWSVKKKGGNDHRPHTALLENEIPILETIDLSEVKEGKYTFIGFPLKLEGLEGAPVRVVLVKK